METAALLALIAMVLVGGISAVIGSFGVRVVRSTSDFLVASRTVGPVANASAISGEYLSAASFLGVAALILREGADGLWGGVAFVGGYLGLVLFVAAPLRRSGAYTVPDFAEARLPSKALRRVSAVVVGLICTLYLLPQLQGAGLVLSTVTGLPSWYGVAGAGAIVLITVLGGGMRSITFVQAFQFWLKFAALAIPAVIILTLFTGQGRVFDQATAPTFPVDTPVQIRVDVMLETAEPITFTARGELDGRPVDGTVTWAPGVHEASRGSTLQFAAGSPVPTIAGRPTSDLEWLEPQTDGWPDILRIYAILIAGFCGVMGMPHVLVRFYTNPDGRAARRTTVVVLAMIGGFYLLVCLLGFFARVYTPQLLVSNADAAVLMLPVAVLGQNWFGWIIAALVAGGAAAAFLATSSGLVVSLAGMLFTDVLRGPLRRFRLAAIVSMVVPMLLALTVTRLDFSITVPLVFGVAASTFCPLLVLGIWWRGLTAPGAIAGMAVGGIISSVAVVAWMLALLPNTLVGELLYRPAVIAVPLAFLTMYVVSRLTRKQIPPGVDATLLRLHAPERLGLQADRRGPS
jgi:Na+(H+)/acetate symporter ActP